jgi:hypothetical protein
MSHNHFPLKTHGSSRLQACGDHDHTIGDCPVEKTHECTRSARARRTAAISTTAMMLALFSASAAWAQAADPSDIAEGGRLFRQKGNCQEFAKWVKSNWRSKMMLSLKSKSTRRSARIGQWEPSSSRSRRLVWHVRALLSRRTKTRQKPDWKCGGLAVSLIAMVRSQRGKRTGRITDRRQFAYCAPRRGGAQESDQLRTRGSRNAGLHSRGRFRACLQRARDRGISGASHADL